MNQENKTVIVVLGMHRSGTSALAGTLSYMGVNFGPEDKLLGSVEDSNAKGHWEHRDIVMLNEQLLSISGSSWDDFRPLAQNLLASEDIAQIKQQIFNVLERDFNNSDICGIKDPRMCKLLPIWNEIFKEVGITPVYAGIIRHPDEVANSLGKRDGFSTEKSHALWLSYVLASEKYSRSYPRFFISYHDLLNDWQCLLEGLNYNTGIVFPPENIQEEKIRQFLSPELRHSTITKSDSPDVKACNVYNIYNCFAGITEGKNKDENIISELDIQYEQYLSSAMLFGPLVYDQDSARHELMELRKSLSALTSEYEDLRDSYSHLESSYKQMEEAYEHTRKAYESNLNELKKLKSNIIWKIIMYINRYRNK